MSRASGPLAERVYSQIYRKIVSGKLGQGSLLVEDDLVDEFSVNRTVIREVIHQMARDGIIRWQNGNKKLPPVVAPLYEREMEELNEIVASLEALAARRIANWPEKKRMKLVRELREHNDRLSQQCKIEPFDIDAILRIDHDFHTTFSYQGVGPRVAALRRAIKPQTERYLRAYLPAFITHTPDAVREHEEIIRAIETGDPEAADKAVHKTWRNGSKRLAEVMPKWAPTSSNHSGSA